MCVCFLLLTAVFSEALVAELAEALEALVDVSHFLLQVRVLLLQLVLFDIPLQGRDHILVYFLLFQNGGKEEEETGQVRS